MTFTCVVNMDELRVDGIDTIGRIIGEDVLGKLISTESIRIGDELMFLHVNHRWIAICGSRSFRLNGNRDMLLILRFLHFGFLLLLLVRLRREGREKKRFLNEHFSR